MIYSLVSQFINSISMYALLPILSACAANNKSWEVTECVHGDARAARTLDYNS